MLYEDLEMTDIGYELRKAPGKGEGVFATKAFKKGDIIMVGHIVEYLDSNNSHAAQISENVFVRHKGIIHKINHCCEPNCGIHVNATGAHDVIARKPIKPGEELSLDYAMRNYRIEYFPKHCRCGAPNCRGKITGWKDLPASRKQEYIGFIAPYLLEMDKKYLRHTG